MSEKVQTWLLLAKKHCGNDVEDFSLIKNAPWKCRELVLEHVWRTMRDLGEVRPPFIGAPEKSGFVKSRRISRVQYSENTTQHGHLVPNGRGFTLLVKVGLTPERERSVIAHELGHTYFFDVTKDPPEPFSTHGFSWENIEGPSYEIGRGILVPRRWLLDRARRPSLESFLSLMHDFRVSAQVLARRLVHDVRLWDILLVISPEHLILSRRSAGSVFKGQSFRSFRTDESLGILTSLVTASPPGKISRYVEPFGRERFLVEVYKAQSGERSFCLIRDSNSQMPSSQTRLEPDLLVNAAQPIRESAIFE